AGQVVEVSVGRKKTIGVVWREVSRPSFEVKPIDTILDIPPVPSAILATAEWMADYYDTHLATVLQTILPTGLNKKRRHRTDVSSGASRKRTHFLLTQDQRF